MKNSDLQNLLANIKDKKIDAAQAYDILTFCCYAEQDKNSKVLNSIWKELENQDNDYQIQHYNRLLESAKNNQDSKLAQHFFDELIKSKIEPDA